MTKAAQYAVKHPQWGYVYRILAEQVGQHEYSSTEMGFLKPGPWKVTLYYVDHRVPMPYVEANKLAKMTGGEVEKIVPPTKKQIAKALKGIDKLIMSTELPPTRKPAPSF